MTFVGWAICTQAYYRQMIAYICILGNYMVSQVYANNYESTNPNDTLLMQASLFIPYYRTMAWKDQVASTRPSSQHVPGQAVELVTQAPD